MNEKPKTTDDMALSLAPLPLPPTDNRSVRSSNIVWHLGKVSTESRVELLGHQPATIWLTGLSGAGKSTLAYELEKTLLEKHRHCFVLDGDNIRHRLNRDLGFSVNDRKENIRRIAEVAHLMNEAGLMVIAAFISPYREDRALARSIIGNERFVEVYLSAGADVCESRDPKGLYAKAKSGEIKDFTGVSAPYEPPTAPEVVLDTSRVRLEDATSTLFGYLAERFFK